MYTDGACRGNPGPGGWAWAVPGGRYASGADAHTTNQRMEITAVLEALRALTPARPAGIDVVSDSTYVVKAFTDRWWVGWLQRGWKNAAKKPVANRDLWEPLLELALAPAVPVSFQWSPEWPLTQRNETGTAGARASSSSGSQRSRFATGFFAAFYQPRCSHPSHQRTVKAVTT